MQLFAGMRVSSTGLAQAERDKLAVLVVQHGGSVLPEMRGECVAQCFTGGRLMHVAGWLAQCDDTLGG